MGNTTSFGVRAGFKKAKGLAPADADLYGGSNSPTFGAGTEILVAEPKIEIAPTMLDDNSINGSQFATGQDVAFIPVKVSGSHDLRTIGNTGALLFSAFGYEALSGPVTIGTKHAHLFLIDPQGKDQRKFTTAEKAIATGIDDDDYLNRYFHFVTRMGWGDLIARNATIKEFTISAEQKGPAKLDFSGSAQDYVKNADNSATTSMTLPATVETNKRFRFSDLLSVGCHIGVWNSAGTAITEERECMVSFNAQQTFGQAEGVATSCSGLSQAEPVADGFNELTIELVRYKVDTSEWLSALAAGTEISFRAEFVVGNYELRLFIPRMKINSVNDTFGEGGRIQLTCKALLATAANDPFASRRIISGSTLALPFSTAMYCILIDDVATNYALVL